jgi:hypothetical protein
MGSQMMTPLQKAAALVALAICFAAAVGGEIWEASNTPHVTAAVVRGISKHHAHHFLAQGAPNLPVLHRRVQRRGVMPLVGFPWLRGLTG